eukprot:TRINITY_DN5327_c0_g1_i2.p1 TRINITY_DN5327_c0_g1~~TRINITY_DN5327_c0_g1_i2.p1  ORF type:complete len:538 (-),score=98.87 TRINITY_DN5327_c0_g1_i2:151-1764(-)
MYQYECSKECHQDDCSSPCKHGVPGDVSCEKCEKPRRNRGLMPCKHGASQDEYCEECENPSEGGRLKPCKHGVSQDEYCEKCEKPRCSDRRRLESCKHGVSQDVHCEKCEKRRHSRDLMPCEHGLSQSVYCEDCENPRHRRPLKPCKHGISQDVHCEKCEKKPQRSRGLLPCKHGLSQGEYCEECENPGHHRRLKSCKHGVLQDVHCADCEGLRHKEKKDKKDKRPKKEKKQKAARQDCERDQELHDILNFTQGPAELPHPPQSDTEESAEAVAAATAIASLKIHTQDDQCTSHTCIKAKVSIHALELLMRHRDPTVRAAAWEAVEDTIAHLGEEEPASQASPEPEDDEKEEQQHHQQHHQQDQQDHQQEPEQEEHQALVPQMSTSGPPMAVVVAAQIDLSGDHTMSEEPSARADVSAEFESLLQNYVHMTQAYCIGRLVVAACVESTRAVYVRVHVTNSGCEPWPAATSLCIAAGPTHGLPDLGLGSVSPGETVELVFDLTIDTGEAGTATRSTWAMSDEHGEPFGPFLFLETHYV